MAVPLEKPSSVPPSNKPPESSRILFLDDDPTRAEVFLAECPQAIWVETVPDCLARLAEPWHEVHLDHDLGGEQFVQHDRQDCGMEVVRWLSLAHRPHLKSTKFYIHSHNPNAANMMGMQLMVNGYKVEVRPFGSSQPARYEIEQDTDPLPFTAVSFFNRLLQKLASILRPKPRAVDPELLNYIRSIAENRARTTTADPNAGDSTQGEPNSPESASPSAPGDPPA